MQLEENPSKGTRVWLTSSEILRLVKKPEPGSSRWTSVNLLARAGLKSNELVSLKRENVTIEGPQPAIVFSGSGTRPQLRKTPIPESVAYTILAYDDGLILDHATRTIRKWVKRPAEELADETGKDGWELVSPSDLRRSWADVLLRDGIPAELVMQWGGWEDPTTFREQFLSRHGTKTSLTEASRSDLY